MTAVSHSKRLPQVHVDGLFFGFYDKLERLEDEEQLRMYFKNPQAAKKLSTVLDSNILLEAFGHATTSMNLNSSRFGKVTTLQVSFGLHPWEFQIRGCHITPFLLEKARSMRLLAQELRLNDTDCSTFAYLGQCEHKLAEFMSKEDTLKKDVERVLSAVLWLGNIELDYNASLGKLKMSSTGASEVPQRVVELLGLESVNILERMLMTRSVTLQSTGEAFELALEKGQVNHVRDTLARLLYQRAFDYIVFLMNEATKMDNITADTKDESTLGPDAMYAHGVSLLKIVDVFGFEDLAHNSLDQLCINYLSEKLYAREEQIVLAAYNYQTPTFTHLSEESKDVLFIYEHPLGVFASLDEITMLHRGESETVQQEEKRNRLFVRNVYERNVPRLPDPPRVLTNGRHQPSSKLSALPFVIPHTRGDVVYDATDFVKKNSDFVYANLLAGLETSNNAHFLRILESNKGVAATFGVTKNALGSADTRLSGSKSLIGQFRSQVNALTIGEDVHMPFYFHCIRPNAAKQPSILNKDIVVQQVHSQRLARQVEVCSSALSSYFAMGISKSTCSLEDRVVAAASEKNHDLWMRIAESEEWAAHRDALVEVGEDPELFLFHSENDEFVVTLERFLEKMVLEEKFDEEQKALTAITSLSRTSTEDEEEEAENLAGVRREDEEMLELLLSVEFGPLLMVAMNQESYFAQALEDPIIMSSMQQLMANPKAFASSTALRHPAVREFFLKLIALSLAVQEQSNEE
ncbi:hypothetical protein BBJ29_002377 [Phytophthora kernoviae]|uniref:Myosin motor domain-containing protein n=1 Tax=Phytophthora kernoviae TaxID=325452 RepID=A0A3F2RRI3_9STRA|nr:hypothetical protein BBJ29_002377 [Phytophthora kernoviae]RLN62787.1 hypothetical protein BBP00_00004531 [Phytophthora kernoviae]